MGGDKTEFLSRLGIGLRGNSEPKKKHHTTFHFPLTGKSLIWRVERRMKTAAADFRMMNEFSSHF